MYYGARTSLWASKRGYTVYVIHTFKLLAWLTMSTQFQSEDIVIFSTDLYSWVVACSTGENKLFNPDKTTWAELGASPPANGCEGVACG